MSQTGHDPRGYNPVNYQHHYHWARFAMSYMDNIHHNLLWAYIFATLILDYILIIFLHNFAVEKEALHYS